MKVKYKNIENYENEYWPQIYDKYNSHLRLKLETEFFYKELKNRSPILECACGTGLIMLELIKRGVDVHGFDISGQMLSGLKAKSKVFGLKNINKKISIKNLANFNYKMKFGGIYIAARSFLHMTTQNDQINALKCIKKHLRKGGLFLMNLFTPDMELLLQYAKPNQEFEYYDTFTIGDNDKIKLYIKQEHDLTNQLQYITWRFLKDNVKHDAVMLNRWITRSEFELLLKLAGFKKWNLYGGFDKKPYEYGKEMVFVVKN